MKKFILAALCVTMLSGCVSSTEYGDCVGIAATQNPALEYKASVWNLFLGFIFIETLIVPIVVLANDAACPVGPSPVYHK